MLQHYEFLIQRILKRHMRGLLKCEKFKYHAIKMMGRKKRSVPNKRAQTKKTHPNEIKTKRTKKKTWKKLTESAHANRKILRSIRFISFASIDRHTHRIVGG